MILALFILLLVCLFIGVPIKAIWALGIPFIIWAEFIWGSSRRLTQREFQSFTPFSSRCFSLVLFIRKNSIEGGLL